MVPTIVDEQFEIFILSNNEYDLTMFKLVEWKQMYQCVSWCKTNKHIGIYKYIFSISIFVEQLVAQHPFIWRWVQKKYKSIVWFLS